MRFAIIKKNIRNLIALVIAFIILMTQILYVGASTGNLLSEADNAALIHLENLYKSYIKKYGDKTTREGLLRVYDNALEIDSDSFAVEKAAGYTVELEATVLRPVDGAKDKDGEIVPSYDGYVNIKAVVTKENNSIGTVEFTEKLAAEVKELTYTKSTDEEDDSVWDIGLYESVNYLNKYTGNADKLIIPDGVEEIAYGDWYKGDKTKVKIVVLSSSMKKVTGACFEGFTNLEAVYIPDECNVIDSSAFKGCTSLRYARLPEGLQTIPKECFKNTPALTMLHIPASVNAVKDQAFNGSALRDIVILSDDFVGDGYDTHKKFVISINNSINAEIKSDVEADLTNDIGNVANRHFYYLGSNPTVKSSWLWYSCDIDSGADYLWYTYIYALTGNSIEEHIAGNPKNNIDDEYTALSKETVDVLRNQYLNIIIKDFDNEEVLEHLEDLYKSYIKEYGDKTTREGLLRVYDKALEVDSDSFAEEKAAGYKVDLDATVLRPVDGAKDKDGDITPSYDGYVNIKAVVTKDNNNVGTVELTEKLKADVKELTYSKSTDEEDNSVWDIGLYESVNYLNKYTGNADKLIIPDGVEEIAYGDWYKGDKTKVKIVVLSSSMKKVTSACFEGFTNLEAVYIPDECNVIDSNAFKGCTSLRYVRLPEGLTTISKECFKNTPALTMLHIPESVNSIKDQAFNGSALRDVVILSDNFVGEGYDTHKKFVISINDGINTEIKSDVEADLTNDIGNVANRHFYYLGSSPTVKSSWLWYSCDIDSGADYLWYTYIYALTGNSIEEHIAGNPKNNIDDEYTALSKETVDVLRNQYLNIIIKDFDNEEVLEHLEDLYKSYIKEYGDKTTREGLLRVYDKALEVDSDSFAEEKAAGYKVDLDATVLRPVDGAKDKDGIIVTARDGYVNINAKVIYKDNEIGCVKFTEVIEADMKMLTYTKSSTEEDNTVWNVGGGKYLNYYEGDADKLVIPEGIEEISSHTLGTWYSGDKTKVQIIVLPSTMKKILPHSFEGFTNLIAIYIPDGCTELGSSAFKGCTSLRYIKLSEKFKSIPEKCFESTSALTQIYIPASIKAVDDRAFYKSAVREIVIISDSFVGNGYDTHKGIVTELDDNINDEIKFDVEADLTNDIGNITNRHFYYLGSNPTVTSSWLWYSCDIDSGADYLWYTYIYALTGNSIEEFIATQPKNNLDDEYTSLNKNSADVLKEQYASYMAYGRYPRELTDDEVDEIVDKYEFTNNGLEAEFITFLNDALADTGHRADIKDWYKLRAVPGCSDQDGMIFAGYSGYVTANLILTSAKTKDEYSIYGRIEPEIYEYTFETVAQAHEFYPGTIDGIDGLIGETNTPEEFFLLSQDGKYLLDYFGSAEKIIIPEGVEHLDQSWWLDTDLSKVRCIILPDSLKSLPDQFGVPFNSTLEVVIMGDNVIESEGKHSFWKCYRLKNLRLSENLENINSEAFFQTFMLTDLRLPNSLKTIEQGAFHLAAIRDIIIPAGVETIAHEAFCWPLRTLRYLEEGVRQQGNSISKELSEELEPYLNKNICLSPGVYIPRTITVLSKVAKYEEAGTYWKSDLSWIPVTVNYVSGSTTEELIDSGYLSNKDIYTYNKLNMSETEAMVNMLSALERVPITSNTKADDILKYLKSVIVTNELEDDMSIVDFELVPANKNANGKVNATINVTGKSGEIITMSLIKTLKYKIPYVVDMSKGSWTGQDFSYSNNFVPNISRFENETVTEYVTIPVEVEIEDSEETEEVIVTTVVKKVRKKNKVKNESILPTIIIVSSIVVVVISALVIFILIWKKKHRKISK